jgi:CIC family chloride channel protein
VLAEKIARRRLLHLTREYTSDPLEIFFAHQVMTHDPVVLRAAVTVHAALPGTRCATLYPVIEGAG